MISTDGWDLALLVVAAYVAIVTLARLMLRYRELLVAQFKAQIAEQRRIDKHRRKRPDKSDHHTAA